MDGTGTEAIETDVWVIGDKIAGIGQSPGGILAERIIDGKGKILAPGFIDIHAHGDPFTDFSNFLYQGVTTICLGMDGFSPTGLTVWLKNNLDSSFTVNVAMFTGHSSIRMESGIEYGTNPTSEDLNRMTSMLDSTLAAGSFGLSTGLEYRPGGLAEVDELEALSGIIAKHNAMITSHVRNEDDDQVEASIKELLETANTAPANVSHIKVVYGKGRARGQEILGLLNKARSKGQRVTADIYPYTASYTGIGILFPDWAKQPNDYEEVKRNRREELREYLLARVHKRNGPEATLIGTGHWKGMNLHEIEKSEKRAWVDILIDEIGPEGASGAYFIMDEELQSTLLIDPFIAIASDGSPTMNHPRGYGTFSKVIRKYVREDSLLSMEEAIRKMTSLPAEILGVQDRGLIEVGKVADLVLFDPMAFKDEATFEDPHRLSTGVEAVCVNGEVQILNGESNSIRGGQLLLRKKYIEAGTKAE